ncbi:MAG: TolC family protein [Deltaproteobacteria bacterium]|nr:TolC family protein [Kofleriaceae bacterium]
MALARPGAAALGVVVAITVPALAHARPITLDEALAAAESNPDIGAASATVDEAEGNLEQADTRLYNPTLFIGGGPSFGPDGTAYDLQISVGQVFELGAKRSKRARVAAAERDAAAKDVDTTRLNVRAEVWRAFHLALVAQQRVEVATDNETHARVFADAAAERVRLGAATQTELNVAIANRGRATAARKAAERDVVLARAALAAAIGSEDPDLEPTGELPTFAAAPTDVDALVAEALANRPDLAALAHVREARDADVELADALAKPDPELSVSWSRSAVEDIDAVTLSVGIALPFWNRNRGGRHAARAASKRASIEVEGAQKEIEREVRAAVRRYQAAIDAVASFDSDVVSALHENLTLAQESLAAGKLDLLELSTVRRDLVDSQLAYLDSLAEAVEARAALQLVVGASLEVAL